MELQFRTKKDCLICRGSKENKDDRVESIYAEPRYDTACTRQKHSSIEKYSFGEGNTGRDLQFLRSF